MSVALTPAELADFARYVQANALEFYRPRPSGYAYYMDREHSVQFACGGKRSTKSWSTVVKNTVAATGIESRFCPGAKPFEPPPHAIRHWCPDLTRVWEAILVPIYLRFIPNRLLDRSGGRRDGYSREKKTIFLTNGSTIQGMSYEMTPMKGESAELYIVAFDEPPRESLYESQLARIVTTGGFIFGAMTLDERRCSWPVSWIDRRILRCGDGPHVTSYLLSTEENIRMIAAEKGGETGRRILKSLEDWKKSLSPAERAVCIEGKGGWLTGLVYPEFEPEVHAQYEGSIAVEGKRTLSGPQMFAWLAANGYGEIWRGLDHGMAHPTACVWWYINRRPLSALKLAEGDIIQYREYKQPGKIPKHIAAIKALTGKEPITGTVASFDLWNDNPQGGEDNATLYIRSGFRRFHKSSRDKDAGIVKMSNLLKVPPAGSYPSWPRLRFYKDVNPESEQEALGYHWVPDNERTSRATNKTVEINDDLLDAQRGVAQFPAAHARPVPQLRPSERDPLTGVPASTLVPLGV